MIVSIAAYCDSAVDYNNQLCILGTFDSIRSSLMPIVKNSCSIALQLQWGKSEEGKHMINVHFINEDGKQMLNDFNSEVLIQIPDPLFFLSTNHIINFQQLKFNKPGTYMTIVTIDGLISAEIQLQVMQDKVHEAVK